VILTTHSSHNYPVASNQSTPMEHCCGRLWKGKPDVPVEAILDLDAKKETVKRVEDFGFYLLIAA
jgi:hypothetical protein